MTYFYEVHWLVPALYWMIGVAIGYAFHALLIRSLKVSADRQARIVVEDARKRAEEIVRDAEARAREDLLKAHEEADRDLEKRRREQAEAEGRMAAREQELARKSEALETRMDSLDLHLSDLQAEKEKLLHREDELARALAAVPARLAETAGLSREEARQQMLKATEVEVRHEAGQMARRITQEAREEAEQKARKIIATAVQRFASDQIHEMTTATVVLPSEEMKGRIIGREGRNIRALEAATGVNILIDDTPKTVTLSGFDPVRREIARIAIGRLVEDGRIHPSTIEDMAAKVRGEMDENIRAAGEQAVQTLDLADVAPDVARIVGRLNYRHSYGQNVLKHSVEVAQIMGGLAGELGLDVPIARRIGLLHDIGKAMDLDIEGSHARAGAEFLHRHGESRLVCNAVAAHHNEVEAESIYAVLIKAADAITAARPGARSENTEQYFRRLEKLEAIADALPGVEKSFALQAGRELRVIVQPEKITEGEAMQMAREICRRIEKELEYPGQIRVSVIRETRAVEYAR